MKDYLNENMWRENLTSQIPPINQDKANKSKGKKQARTIAVTSGKGGVGKTNFVVNVALELGKLGFSVTVLDADFALGNTDLLLGINPVYHIGHLFSGERRLEEIMVEIAPGVNLIPASSGLDQLAHLSYQEHKHVLAQLEQIENDVDFLIIDTPAGIASNVLNFLRVVDDVIVVAMPEPTSIIDAYATIKVLYRQSPNKRTWVVVNKANSVEQAKSVFEQINMASLKFLNHALDYLGSIPNDPEISEAINKRTPIVKYAPTLPISRSFRFIANNFNTLMGGSVGNGNSFWHTLANIL